MVLNPHCLTCTVSCTTESHGASLAWDLLCVAVHETAKATRRSESSHNSALFRWLLYLHRKLFIEADVIL